MSVSAIAPSSSGAPASPVATTSLQQRFAAAVQPHASEGGDGGEEIPPIMEELVQQWWAREFMEAMLYGEEHQTGLVTPEPWA